MKLTLSEIVSAVGGRITENADRSKIIRSIFTDSREAEDNKSGLFAAIRGEHFDAHDFVKEVTEKGCFAMIENENYFSDQTVLVNHTREALQNLAVWYRKERLKQTKIIAVTGSVGKTSTKDMVALAVGAGLVTSKTQGNRNSQIGLPITILDTPPETEAAVLEVGMSEPGEMGRLSRVSQPDIAIITNIGYSHIEALGSRERICEEKLTVADYMPEDGILVLNGDEILLRNDSHPQKKIFCSVSNKDCDCYAEAITEEETQTSFKAHILGESVQVCLFTRGIHNVSNALFALTATSLLGIELKKAAEALKAFETNGLRQKIYKKDDYTIIADCYNASPESMKAALSVLGEQKGRKIAVLGDMLELGSFAPMLHEKVGGFVLDNRIDILITFGTLAKQFAAPVNNKIMVYSFEESEYDKAAVLLKALIKPGDTVLYKASNRMKLQKIIELV